VASSSIVFKLNASIDRRAILPKGATSRQAEAIPTQSFPQSREFTLPQYQSSGVSPSAPPHSIGTNRG
jgi:hypothetical protein